MTIKKSIKIMKIVKDYNHMKKIVKIRYDQISSVKVLNSSSSKCSQTADLLDSENGRMQRRASIFSSAPCIKFDFKSAGISIGNPRDESRWIAI